MDTKQILAECSGFSDECLAPVKVGTVKALCKQISRLEADFNDALVERNNAEKREYEVLGRANALETELKATQARLDASDELLREEFAQRQDALATLRDIGDFAHDRSTGPAVEDALWEVRRMAYELLTPNA